VDGRALEVRHPRQGRPAHPLLARRAAPGRALAPRRRETREAKPKRVVVSFGPEHAPLEQRQVGLALEEAQALLPKPGIVAFAAFHFDPVGCNVILSDLT
jgi:hypothetical protein